MLLPVAGAWPGLAGVRSRSIFNTFVFLWQAQANQGHIHWPGQTKKGFLCATLCDMKWTVSLTFVRCKFDSLMVSCFGTSLQGRKCDILIDPLE